MKYPTAEIAPAGRRRNANGEPARRPAPGRGTEAFARYERARSAIMVGSAVRAARRRVGMSQVELARLAGTSQPSVARLERGLVSPTVISLDRIARALGAELVIDFEPAPAGGRGGGLLAVQRPAPSNHSRLPA
ncbi:MAG TPA: helix-turn-helix transcriptional regulator [Acidimicrobiales bacterium]|nr:helix-turn-helix transcriptional regulator [Acidimicrobiales bacterium]